MMNKRLCLVALLSVSIGLFSACGLLPRGATAVPTPIPPTPTQSHPTAAPAPTTEVPATATTVPAVVTPAAATATTEPTTAPATATPEGTPAPKPPPDVRIVLSEVSLTAASPGVVHVAGKAQVFEATLAVALVDASGQVIARGAAHASMGAPEWGDFAIDFYYPPPATAQQVTLQAYEPSPKDGSPNSLVEKTIVLQPVPDLASWKSFDNPTYHFTVGYPSDWYVNQGSVMPAPPRATKFSTYQVRAPGEPLGDDQAEIWITVSDVPSVAEMDNLKAKGYKETAVVVGGRQGVRYTAPQPGHGVSDVVYTLSGTHEYRLQLSAATHDFDSTFALVLATFSIAE
jgi:hypothetical protein